MIHYYDENGNVRKELLQKEAEDAAQTFVKKIDVNKFDTKFTVSSAQMRRFYGEFKELEKKLDFKSRTLKDRDAAFISILPLVKMVKSKVAYAANPSNPKIPQKFKIWMDENIEMINTVKDFEAFLLYFESVVGFYYGLGVKNS